MSSLQFNTSAMNHLNENKHKNETIKNIKINEAGKTLWGKKYVLKKI